MGELEVKTKAPCREACPAGVDVPRYVRCIKEGKFDQALSVIRERIPFPAVCAYACVHPCESKCARQQYDEPVAIRMLKRAAVEKGGEAWKGKLGPIPPTGKKVAVVGAGPCGLTAAYYLAGKGHRVTVFEVMPSSGGMLRYGIPEYRLPKEVVDREINVIKDRGVEIKTGARVESAEKLLYEGYDAVLVAAGSWLGLGIELEGGSVGVMDGISFLRAVNTGNPPAVGEKVLVVGGGNTAIDAARSSVRLGAREVVVLYRRTRAEMPASPEEVAEAVEEGIKFEFLATPKAIEKNNVVCVRMALGEPDESGRPRPVPVEGSEFTISCNTMIAAVGQSADAFSLGLEGNADGTIKVDPDTLATSLKGVFAAGDAVTGPSSIIQAIAQGRRAASSIDKYLGGNGVIDEKLAEDTKVSLREDAPRGTARHIAPAITAEERKGGFKLVEQGYDDLTAVREAQRCLSCDLRHFNVEVNVNICKGCGYCKEVCTLGVFTISGFFNSSGYKPMVAAHTEKCMGCLRCLTVCPDFAITVREMSVLK
ncbi:4Fe-4S dicluster domain-containing protein [Desulfofundulus salinus]|uniref:4Fe-4S dicluster domain-containing protein n=1 Tax=Desulfofundulus salinus TaxID=2419843 RepID=A0A494WXL8_9FIRM|nr:4Fe-4S dicluster domain-containing protein [Desulfofundulus salinum]